MSVIFLDFDGVLNSSKFLYTPQESDFGKSDMEPEDQISKEMVSELNRIIRETGADVVISSTWRVLFPFDDLLRFLKNAGFVGKVVGKTPIHFSYCQRGIEIQQWIDLNKFEGKFVILDDNSDMCHLAPFLIQTEFENGLTREKADEAILVLKR